MELLDLGQRLITETRSLLRFVGKSKLASLYKPLDRAALMLLTSDRDLHQTATEMQSGPSTEAPSSTLAREKSWIVEQLVYHQRLVLNAANDDKLFLQGLVSHLIDFVLSNNKEMRDASMSLFKLLLIVWEPVMQECLVLPATKTAPQQDLFSGGFDRLLQQGVSGFEDWIQQHADAALALLSETASKPWLRALAALQKGSREASKALAARQVHSLHSLHSFHSAHSTHCTHSAHSPLTPLIPLIQAKITSRRLEREIELQSSYMELDSARKMAQQAAHISMGLGKSRVMQQERAQYRALVWAKTGVAMEEERGIFGPEDSQWALHRWKLASIEGPYRMRLRMEVNETFAIPAELILREGDEGVRSSSPSSVVRECTPVLEDEGTNDKVKR